MSQDEGQPLEPDMRALVDRNRHAPEPSAGAQARVFAALEGVLGLGGGGPPPGGAPGDVEPGAGASSPAARSVRGYRGLGAGFVLGAAVGAVAMRALSGPVAAAPVAAAPVERPAPRPATAVASVQAPPGASEEAIVTPPPSRAQSTSKDDLAAERAILDRARHALEREDGESALSAAAEHERRFPVGLLAQEREAMAVRALAILGRVPEARARAERFRARYPDSLLLPALRSTVGPMR